MDGVPGLTQPPIPPGETFAYAFTPPDAGTFWYHSHEDSAVQLGRGLAGALIVEEPDPPPVDRDLVWVIQDWRLTPDGQITPGFVNAMEAAMSGRVGNTITINGRVPDAMPVRAGERIRLRLVNAASARIMALRFEGHRPVVIALDGQPCEPHEPEDKRVLLGPAMRADLMLRSSTISTTACPTHWFALLTTRRRRCACMHRTGRFGCHPIHCRDRISRPR
jgi:FtsP/CotA-like multicopper oxidase with cupredoxin domain